LSVIILTSLVTNNLSFVDSILDDRIVGWPVASYVVEILIEPSYVILNTLAISWVLYLMQRIRLLDFCVLLATCALICYELGTI